jgi:hypothetical protein
MAGGFLQTEVWGYERLGNTCRQILPEPGSPWRYAPRLLGFLTQTESSAINMNPPVQPRSTFRRTSGPRSIPPVTYADFERDLVNLGVSAQAIKIGDLVFYGESIEHVAVIVGWGCPFGGCEAGVQHPVGDFQPTPGYGLMPWVIDHGLIFMAQGASENYGKARPFDRTFTEGGLKFTFALIPDTFRLYNVRRGQDPCPLRSPLRDLLQLLLGC